MDKPEARARETLRQVEQRLAAQAATKTAIETRATAIFNWAATAALAAVAVVYGQWGQPAAWGAGAAMVALAGAFVCACKAMWPDAWGVAGHLPAEIAAAIYDPAENGDWLAWLADGMGDAAAENVQRLADAAWWLRRAIISLGAAPLLAALALSAAWFLGVR